MTIEEIFLNELNFHIRQGISKKDLTDLINERIEALTIPVVISCFSVGDTVRLVSKREFYCSTRIGSKGVILKSSNSPFGVCHWIKFKTHENWIYEDQLDFW